MVEVVAWGIALPDSLFLGYPVNDWLRVLACVRCRKISVLDLVKQFEEDHPIGYYAWKEQFGLLADIQEEIDASETP